MTIHRLSAGSGYRYLTRTTARGDADPAPSTSAQSLTAYYTASGTPPGRWYGTGLAGLAGGVGIPTGTVVDEAAMAALFGIGRDPVTGMALGKANPKFRTTLERVSDRMARLPAGLTLEQRATLSERFTAEETAQLARAAVAGFDLTFTAPKSVSVLWALADPTTQAEIVAAHHAAVADTLAVLEATALFTRVGAGSCAQVATRGAIATGFDHVDTRTGDPNLHTHLVLANKVQGADGAWRSVDSRALYTAAVALSETYDSLIANHLSTRLGIGWEWRDRGRDRSASYEITGIDDDLLAAFSTRSAAITARTAELVGELVAATGRRPTRAQVLKLRQQAALDTRPDKTPHTLVEQMATWRHRAARAGHPPVTVTRRAIGRGAASHPSGSGAPLDDAAVAVLAGDVLAGLVERRATWTSWNALAETARATRHLRFTSAAGRITVHDRVVDAALAACVRVDPDEPYTVPRQYRRSDGASVFTRAGTTRYTHAAVLAAEQRLLDAHADTAAPTVARAAGDATATEPALTPDTERPVPELAEDQAHAVHALCTSGRRVEILIGPAGSGKTTTLRAVRRVWERRQGPGSVIGLAPSASAARELARSLQIPCENTAKWLHETTPGAGGTWRMRGGQLVIVDEASLAPTRTLDALTGQARAADAKLLLVGDHHQLGPVDAGGVFALLAGNGQPLHLQSLWRFTHQWEAHATMRLRDGDPGVLDAYADHGRLHDGHYEHMLEAAYGAWTRDTADGAGSVLLAADRATVTALNHRARTDRITAGTVAPEGIITCDGATIGAGDRIITRRNDRRLTLPAASTDGSSVGGAEYVRNGMLWDVVGIGPDGSLIVIPAGDHRAASIVLPADYARRHADLGYALTLHRAQGITVETAHLITTTAMTRESLYVGLTRGRKANHVYTATDVPPSGAAHHVGVPAGSANLDHPPTGREILAGILAITGTEPAATTALSTAAAEAFSPDRLRPVAATLIADIIRRRWFRLLTHHLGSDLAHRLNQHPAIGVLHAALSRAESAGHSPVVILEHLTAVADQATSPAGADDMPDDVHRLARALDAWADNASAPSLRDPRDFLRHRPVADPGDPAAFALDDIHRLVDARIAQAFARNHATPPPVHPAPTRANATATAAAHLEGPAL